MISIDWLPHCNAVLNSTSAVLLLTGYVFIKKGNKVAHKRCMLSAFLTSTLFLVGYLTYHYFHGTTRFPEEGAIRTLYFTILISHTILAVVIVPMVLRTLYLAFREKFEKHRRLARFTFPIWLYVSVTGVLVYFFLYHWFPSA